MQINSIAPAFAVTNLVVATTACKLISLKGYSIGSADKWLQVHDAAALPSNGAVPLRSFQLLGALDYFKAYDPTPLPLATGLVVAVSDTEGTLTISSATADIMVDLEAGGQLPTGTTSVGDDTPTDALEVWASAAGPKNLVSMYVSNGEGVPIWVMLFAFDSPTVGKTPIWISPRLAIGAAKTYNFGDDGMNVFTELTTGTLRQGCTIALSTTEITLTPVAPGSSIIHASYK